MLEVLVEGEDIVLLLFLFFLLFRRLVAGHEVDGPAVGRPLQSPDCGSVVGKPPGLAAGGSHQIDLVLLVVATPCHEGDVAPVRRPERTVLTSLAVRQLHRRAALDVKPPNVANRPVLLPVGLAFHIEKLSAIGRELGATNRRQIDQIDDRHRARPLLSRRRRKEEPTQQGENGGESRQPPHHRRSHHQLGDASGKRSSKATGEIHGVHLSTGASRGHGSSLKMPPPAGSSNEVSDEHCSAAPQAALFESQPRNTLLARQSGVFARHRQPRAGSP